MREIRARRLSAGDIAEIVIQQEPVILYAGKTDGARVYGLPVKGEREDGMEWETLIDDTYSTDPIRVDRTNLGESILLAIVTGQVDRDWRPCAWGILFVGDTASLYLVPENEPWKDKVDPWRARVEGEVSE